MLYRDDLWYKEAVIYSLDVDAFQDSDGDGIGDFVGLTRRLEHLRGLGVTCLWLLPFFPSPDRDNGYDVKDFYAVDPRLGSLGDFVDFTRAARERGMRVIIDLVVNHVSVDHPWFRAARKDPKSPFRDWFVWSEKKPPNSEEGIVFPGEQTSMWTYDEKAGAWYMHRFYEHQPDLNIANPAVREEIRKIMGFWLELGVSGFRVDAAPFLVELHGLDRKSVSRYRHGREPHDFLGQMREFLRWRRGDAVLLAEANVEMKEVKDFFGADGDRMHLLFHFMANQHLFLALARGEAEPVARGLQAPPETPELSQWAHFLRNHDELDLGRLSEGERAEVFAAFGIEPDMVLFERGPRRRLPPMLGGDRRRVELAYSLMVALPGTPVLRYGEEIGMGDDLSLEGREAVRTAMQWSSDANGGFSTAPARKLLRPVISEGPYAYARLNVRDQRGDPGSLLNWMQRLIAIRRNCPELAWGKWEVIDGGDPAILAVVAEWQDGVVLTLHNLAGELREAAVDLSRWASRPMQDLMRQGGRGTIGREAHRETMEPYAYRWYRLGADDAHYGWEGS